MKILAVLITGGALLAVGCSGVPKTGYEPTYPEVAAPPEPANGAIYQSGYAMSLFDDRRARRVGDLITIVLNENTTADKQAETTTSKENDIDIASPTLFGYTLPRSESSEFTLQQQLQSSQDFSGSGSSSQSNSLAGTITVTVAEVLPNGYLLVRGQKWLTLNQGAEYVQLSGIVRPEDVSGDNTVLSTQVADARIIYKGRGAVASANRAGWLSRFFLSPIWPF